LVMLDLWFWFHLYWHCASFLPGTRLATFCQSVFVKHSGLRPL
jgi:hypothetical protein